MTQEREQAGGRTRAEDTEPRSSAPQRASKRGRDEAAPDPESPGATIDSPTPAEPNEPG